MDDSVKAVSLALSESDGDLLKTIERLRETWQSELSIAKSKARKQHGDVLNERQALQNSLGTAAKLWGTLGSNDQNDFGNEELSSISDLESIAVALDNVSQTLQYLEFFEEAPSSLEKAHKALMKIIDNGPQQFISGNASGLYDIHATLAAVERVRDLTLLEKLPHLHNRDSVFHAPHSTLRVEQTRKALDQFLMHEVFGNILGVAQSNPRFLVAAVRIVQEEETRDSWWDQHLASRKLEFSHSLDGVMLRRDYKKRMFDSIASRIDSQFSEMDNKFSANAGEQVDIVTKVQSTEANDLPEVEEVLKWVDDRISENHTIQRFVVPCMPSSFAIAEFYEEKLHHRLMTTLLGVFRTITRLGNEAVQQDGMMKVMMWYSSYRQGVGRNYSGIDSYLEDGDRRELVKFMRVHVANTVGSRINSVLNQKEDGAQLGDRPSAGSNTGLLNADNSRLLGSADMPDAVFDCINNLVTRASSLGIGAVRKAVAVGIADSLQEFQSALEKVFNRNLESPVSQQAPKYICSVANNMASCLEYSEELRDSLSNSIDENDRMDVARALEVAIEGFRRIAVLAISDLIQGLDQAVSPITAKLFAPNTGTDTMLDIVGTLQDSFALLEEHLLPIHFEQLATECLRNVVAHYVTPFVQLGQQDLEMRFSGEIGRASISDEASQMSSYFTRDRIVLDRVSALDRMDGEALRSRRRMNNATGGSRGLTMMTSAAVVAQIDKDIENLTNFFHSKVELYHRKQLQAALEPMHTIRALYTCAPTPSDLVETYQAAKASVSRAVHKLVIRQIPCSKILNVRAAEAIWTMRLDVSSSVRDEAVMYANETSPTGREANRTSSHYTPSSGTPKDTWTVKRSVSINSRYSADASTNGNSSLLWSPSVSVQKGSLES